MNHEAALLRRMLDADHSEAVLFGLGGGIGFMYFVFEYEGHPPIVTIVAQAHPEPIIPRALDRLGVPHTILRTGSARVAERNLRAVLDAGRRPICRVDRHRLPWRAGPAFPDPVDVAVTGIDGDTVHVVDVEPATLSLAGFMAAWSAVKKEKHQLIDITGSGGAAPDVAGAIKETAARLTGPVLGNAFDVNFGLSGMRKLAAQLADTTSKQGWTRRFADPAVALDRLRDCLEVEYTAPGASRPLYADFLAEVGQDAVAEVYRDAGARWSAVSAAALAREPFVKVAELVAAAVQVEERAAELLGRL